MTVGQGPLATKVPFAFNMNDYVRVKLTAEGKAMLAREAAELRRSHPKVTWSYIPPLEDEEGYSKWQLWKLMSEFGPHIHLGCRMLFDPVILFDVPKETLSGETA